MEGVISSFLDAVRVEMKQKENIKLAYVKINSIVHDRRDGDGSNRVRFLEIHPDSSGFGSSPGSDLESEDPDPIRRIFWVSVRFRV